MSPIKLYKRPDKRSKILLAEQSINSLSGRIRDLEVQVIGDDPLRFTVAGSFLVTSTLVGATSVQLNTFPAWATNVKIYLVIDAGTSEAEIRQVNTVTADNLASFTVPLSYAHAAEDPVLFESNPDVDPKWFGAIGDNVIDDLLSLQRAITQITLFSDPRGKLILRDNVYLANGTLTLPSNITIEGSGMNITVLRGTILSASSKSGIVLKNFTVNKTNGSAAISFSNCTDCMFYGVKAYTNRLGHGFVFSSCLRFILVLCLGYYCYNSFQLTTCENFTFIGCKTRLQDGYGYYFVSNCANIIIAQGQSFYGGGLTGYEIYTGNPTDRIVIQATIADVSYGIYQYYFTNTEDVAISGCELKSIGGAGSHNIFGSNLDRASIYANSFKDAVYSIGLGWWGGNDSSNIFIGSNADASTSRLNAPYNSRIYQTSRYTEWIPALSFIEVDPSCTLTRKGAADDDPYVWLIGMNPSVGAAYLGVYWRIPHNFIGLSFKFELYVYWLVDIGAAGSNIGMVTKIIYIPVGAVDFTGGGSGVLNTQLVNAPVADDLNRTLGASRYVATGGPGGTDALFIKVGRNYLYSGDAGQDSFFIMGVELVILE